MKTYAAVLCLLLFIAALGTTLDASSPGAIRASASNRAFSDSESSNFVYTIGGAIPAPDHYTITNSLGAVAVTAKTDGSSWVQVSLSSPVTPAILTISVQPTGLSPGSYNSNVTVSSSTESLTIAVSLNVLPSITISVSPSSLAFEAQAGSSTGSVSPQVITLTSASASTYTAFADGGSWLRIVGDHPAGGSAFLLWQGKIPGQIAVFVDSSGLAAGVYQGQVSVIGSDTSSALAVAVTLTITAPPGTLQPPAPPTFSECAGVQDTSVVQPESVSMLNLPCLASGLGRAAGMPLFVPHYITGDAWSSVLRVTSTGGADEREFVAYFFNDLGHPQPLSVNGGTPQSYYRGTLPSYGGIDLRLKSTGLVSGSILIDRQYGSGPIESVKQTGMHIAASLRFGWTVSGRPDFEAAVPAIKLPRSDPAYVVPSYDFDNTSGYKTGLVIQNLSQTGQEVCIMAAIDGTGEVGGCISSFVLQPGARKVAFLNELAPVTAGSRGLVRVGVNTPFTTFPLASMMLLYNPGGAFTALNPIVTPY